ncbi:hypothetical protein [Pollutibacter soli]|uniref:DoxX family protein n=1 Tax=Pollutibacter soli TaxID=3034157 RepID=UPI003013E5A6
MHFRTSTGRTFYAIALIIYGVQQFVFGDFRPVFVPAWQNHLPGLSIWAYIFGLLMIVTAILILTEKYARTISAMFGVLLLVLFFFIHIPFELIADPDSKHLAMWTSAFKDLAIAGGAFVVAGSFLATEMKYSSATASWGEKIIPAGRIFFSITMITFGITHLLYGEFVMKLVPEWIPAPLFWTYFAAVALIGSGMAIILKIKVREVASLLSLMLFIWFVILHLPRAIDDPLGQRGNEFASSFDALAFCGTALLISATGSSKSKLTL